MADADTLLQAAQSGKTVDALTAQSFAIAFDGMNQISLLVGADHTLIAVPMTDDDVRGVIADLSRLLRDRAS